MWNPFDRLRILVAVSTVAGCGTTAGQIHELADADTPRARARAIQEAVERIGDRRAPEALRRSAIRVLGRLRSDSPRPIEVLETVLTDGRAPQPLRCMAAWSLGELRAVGSLKVLTAALRAGVEDDLAAYVLEGLAKHTALMTNHEETLMSVVESLVFYAGNRRKDLPPTYQLLSDHTRTVEVNVEVLRRSLDRLQQNPDPRRRSAMYAAAFELLARLDERQSEIAAGPAVWSPQVDAAVTIAGRAYRMEDLRTQLLVLFFLGRLGQQNVVARRSALLADELKIARSPEAPIQLLAVWGLNRLQLLASSSRQALVNDLLIRIEHPAVLRMIGDLGRVAGQPDAPQKWLELGGAP
ncbi:MAG: HEAT repeat domain-containing protein [Myxococcota bacterium]